VGPGLQQRERHLAIAVLEQVPARAHDDRVDEQGQLVEQSRLEQEPDEGAAGPDGDVPRRAAA
jgi:hypothetical protein